MWIYDNKSKDITIIEKILLLLTLKLNYVLCSIERAKDINELFIYELQSSLLIHEQRLNQQDKKEQNLQVSSNNHFSTSQRKGKAK